MLISVMCFYRSPIHKHVQSTHMASHTLEFFLNEVKLSLNSVNSANWSNNESMNLDQLKILSVVCVSVALWYHLCLLSKRLWVWESLFTKKSSTNSLNSVKINLGKTPLHTLGHGGNSQPHRFPVKQPLPTDQRATWIMFWITVRINWPIYPRSSLSPAAKWTICFLVIVTGSVCFLTIHWPQRCSLHHHHLLPHLFPSDSHRLILIMYYSQPTALQSASWSFTSIFQSDRHMEAVSFYCLVCGHVTVCIMTIDSQSVSER